MNTATWILITVHNYYLMKFFLKITFTFIYHGLAEIVRANIHLQLTVIFKEKVLKFLK